jgi:hypothetical protein
MAEDVVYIHHKPAEFKAFRSPQGMSGRWTFSQAEQVAAHARLLAPKPGQGKGYATGELAANIHVKGPTIGRRGPEAEIVSSTDHSVFVHEGTPPHIIKPRFAEQLVFFWRKAGRIVFKDKVRHPGTKANKFLLNALREVFGGPGR